MYHNNTSPYSILILSADSLSGGETKSANDLVDRTGRNAHPFLNLMTIMKQMHDRKHEIYRKTPATQECKMTIDR